MEGLEKKVLDVVKNVDEEVRTDNANKLAELFATQRDLVAGVVASEIAHNSLLPKKVSEWHKLGKVHMHDLQYFPLQGSTNCCLLDIKGMLETGFELNNVSVESPKGIHTAMTLASQVLMAVGSSQYGGVSFDRFDETLAPYVTMSYDKLVIKGEKYKVPDAELFAKEEIRKVVYDACQTLLYQINSMTCTSGQSPFISVGYGLGTSWEAKLVQEMLMKVQYDGIGKHKITPVFPKLIYSIKEGLNRFEGDPNYDMKKLAVKCSAKRMYPDILNYDKVVEVTGGFKASMGCRSFLSYWEDEDGVETYSGRCNLGVVSMNIVMAAMEAEKDLDKFWGILDEYLEVARRGCEYRLEVLAKTQAKSAPVLFTQGGLLRLDPEEYVLPHLLAKGASISIGYIGLMETVNALVGGNEHIFDSKSKQELGLEILKYIEARIEGFKETSGVGYSCYATPSESQCKRMRDAVFNKFGLVDGVTDKEYLTNSFHLEAGKQTNAYDRMDYEAQFVPHSSGGFISYGEFPDMTKNEKALEDVWDYSYNVTPYYAVNVAADKCYECGFEGELLSKSKGFTCPDCGNSDQLTVYACRRVSGYLGSPSARPFNTGKTAEMNDRVKNT